MRVEFLGTGTSQGIPVIGCSCPVCSSQDPRDDRLRSSVLVQACGRTLLIDAGPDLRQQMLRSGVQRLDAVLLTHEHMDHVGGIDELRSFNFLQGRAMEIHANEATRSAVRTMYHYAFAEKRYPGVPQLELKEVPDGLFRVHDVPVLPITVMHHFLPVLGFRIGGFAYVTDAKTIPEAELDKLRGAEVLVLNALRREEHISHLNLSEALALVRELRPVRAYFTHISHLLGTHAELEAELPEGVSLAHDGLVLELPEP